MPTKYKYQVVKSSWGIAAEVTAEAISIAGIPGEALQLVPGLWFAVNQAAGATPEDIVYLVKGITLVAREIRTRSNRPMLIRVLDLSYSPGEYQPEGAACAILGWAAREFGFPAPEIFVRFDEPRNRYVFDFDR